MWFWSFLESLIHYIESLTWIALGSNCRVLPKKSDSNLTLESFWSLLQEMVSIYSTLRLEVFSYPGRYFWCIVFIDLSRLKLTLIWWINIFFQGHITDVLSVCWDYTGKYVLSVSEESARVWSTLSGGNCIYELLANGNKFQSCTIHPDHDHLWIIGGYEVKVSFTM